MTPIFSPRTFVSAAAWDCYSGSSTDILLTRTAISDNLEDTVEDQAAETVTTTQHESGIYPFAPTVTIASANFAPIDASAGGPHVSNGSNTFTYSGAPATCGCWVALVSF